MAHLKPEEYVSSFRRRETINGRIVTLCADHETALRPPTDFELIENINLGYDPNRPIKTTRFRWRFILDQIQMAWIELDHSGRLKVQPAHIQAPVPADASGDTLAEIARRLADHFMRGDRPRQKGAPG